MFPLRMLVFAAALGCAACSPPGDPPGEGPPEPQAGAVRDALRAPIDRAQAAEGAVRDAAEAQRASIEATVE